MSILDLRCLDSVSSTKDCQFIESDKNYLRLGGGYQIYLSFEQPPYSSIKRLRQAKLILYKIPSTCEEEQIRCDCTFYTAYPLLEYFSVFSCMYESPAFDYRLEESFKNTESRCYIEADISCIVRAWLNDEIEDKGLLLSSKSGSRLLTFASDAYGITGMHPFIRLDYEERTCEPMASVPCVVQID